MNTRLSRLCLAAALVAAVAACKPNGTTSPFHTLDRDATSLRDRFNADIGKVRVVLLVAPT